MKLVKAPTLVLHPRGDVMVPFDQGRIIAAGIPDANSSSSRPRTMSSSRASLRGSDGRKWSANFSAGSVRRRGAAPPMLRRPAMISPCSPRASARSSIWSRAAPATSTSPRSSSSAKRLCAITSRHLRQAGRELPFAGHRIRAGSRHGGPAELSNLAGRLSRLPRPKIEVAASGGGSPRFAELRSLTKGSTVMLKRLSIFAYGLVCYAVFLATFLYALGFVGNFCVPRSIDGEPRMDFRPRCSSTSRCSAFSPSSTASWRGHSSNAG